MDVEEFLETRMAHLLRVALLLTGRRHDAEDLVQDVLATVVLKWRRVGRADDVDAYVRRMLVNTWISRCRKRSSKELVDHDVVVSDGRGPAQPDPAGHVVDAEVLWAAVATLPPRQRAAVVLRFYEDLPDARAADALGCSTGAYRVLVHRGVAALRGQTGLGDAPLPDTSDRSPKGALR
jgi:RNA polymerase sigma-70 factor (sigma-E family)